MTYRRVALLLSAGIVLAAVTAGCKSQPLTLPPPPPPRREAPLARPAPREIPPRPLTRGILELIEKSSYETRELQYFLSSTVTLEHGKGMQIDIALDQSGQGFIQEINAQEKIIILKDTGGVLVPEPGSALPGGPRTLKICFEDRDDHALTFRENPSDHRYYLVFREDRQYGEFTDYGGESWRVTFDGEIPYLYVKLDEQTDDQPRIRQLQGRYVSADASRAPPAAETPPAQETVAPGRSPQPAAAPQAPTPAPSPQADPGPAAAPQTPTPAPSPQADTSPAAAPPASAPAPSPQAAPPPPAEEEEEELDLEALLGL